MARWLLAVPVVLMIVSCCLPSLEFNGERGVDVMVGGQVLALGGLGLLIGIPGWLANPIWLAGVLLGLFRRRKGAAIAGGLAVLIACTVFSLIGREVPTDEGGVNHMHLARLLPGFYVWLLSLASLVVVSLPRIAK